MCVFVLHINVYIYTTQQPRGIGARILKNELQLGTPHFSPTESKTMGIPGNFPGWWAADHYTYYTYYICRVNYKNRSNVARLMN